MAISLEEAKSMMSQESFDNLREVVTSHPNINMDNKVNCDILMQALCRAITDEVIKPENLDEKTIKLLNAKTNTLSPKKLGDILSTVRKNQPNIGCVITMIDPKEDTIVREWIFVGPNVNFINVLGEVISIFEITPSYVRNKMTETLKPTIVNNIAQLVARYQNAETKEDYDDINVSISTITRLVNMSDHLLYADFKEVEE